MTLSHSFLNYGNCLGCWKVAKLIDILHRFISVDRKIIYFDVAFSQPFYTSPRIIANYPKMTSCKDRMDCNYFFELLET